MKYLIILFISFAVINSQLYAGVDCNALKQDISAIDTKLNEFTYQCEQDKSSNLCELPYQELVKIQNDLMSQLLINDGLVKIKNGVASKANALSSLQNLDTGHIQKSYDELINKLEFASFVQESFKPDNKKGKLLWIDFQTYLDSNPGSDITHYLTNKCSDQELGFEICAHKDEILANSDYQAEIQSMALMATRLDGDDDQLKIKYQEFYDKLKMRWADDKYTSMKDILDDDTLEQLPKIVSETKAQNLSKSQTLDRINYLEESLKSLVASENRTEYVDIKDKVKAFQQQLMSFKDIVSTSSTATVDDDTKQMIVKHINDGEKAQLKLLSERVGPTIQSINKKFSFQCRADDAQNCLKQLEDITKKTCPSGDTNCQREKTFASQLSTQLSSKMDSEILKSASKARECLDQIDSDFFKCAEIDPNLLSEQRTNLLAKSRAVEAALKAMEASNEIKQYNRLKSFALYKLRQDPNCLGDNHQLDLSRSCIKGQLETEQSSILSDSTGEIISFYTKDLTKNEAIKIAKDLVDVCSDGLGEALPAICKNQYKVYRTFASNSPTVVVDDYITYDPDTYGTKGENIIGGFLMGVAETGLGGYAEYSARRGQAQQTINQAKQYLYYRQMYNQGSVYQNTYMQQMNRLYYPYGPGYSGWGLNNYSTAGGTYFTNNLNPALYASDSSSNFDIGSFAFNFESLQFPTVNTTGTPTTPTTTTTTTTNDGGDFGFSF